MKTIGISILVHVLVFSLVWIGFSVPMPRKNTQFSYQGSLMPSDELSDKEIPLNKPVSIKTEEGAFFSPWIQMRDLDKPKR